MLVIVGSDKMFLILSTLCCLDEIPVAILLRRRDEPEENEEEDGLAVEQEELPQSVLNDCVLTSRLMIGWWVIGSIPFLSSLFLRQEFQWFLMSLSDRPGICCAMVAHLQQNFLVQYNKNV